MHKRSFQALKRTFMHVAGLTPTCFENKTITLEIRFLSKKTMGEDLRP